MTTIATIDGKLYADRRVLVHSRPLTFVDGSKISVSANKQMAYVSSGDIIRDDQREAFEEMLQQTVGLTLRKEPLPEELVTQLKGYLDGTSFLVLTRDHTMRLSTFTRTSKGAMVNEYVRFLPRDGLSALGTGGDFLYGAWFATRSVEQAYRVMSELDNYSSAIYDTIDSRDLEVFDMAMPDEEVGDE